MAPKVNRRPAGAPRPPRVLRRPAAPAAEEVDRGEEALREEDLAIGTLVHGEDAAYHNTPCQFSGRVIETTKDASGRYLVMKLMGTILETLLTWGTGTSHPARVHLCPAECSQEAVGPGLIHCRRYRTIASLDELAGHPWRDVLVSAVPRDGDELAGLRGRMEDLPIPPGGEGAPAVKKGEKDEAKVKDKKKRKKKRSRRGRKRSSSTESKRKRRSRSSRPRRRGGEKDKKTAGVIGAWSVPVVTRLISQLVGPRGLGPPLTPTEILRRLDLEGNPYIQSRLMRPPLSVDQSLTGSSTSALVQQLGRLVSTKGADLMLNSTPDEIQGHQRRRHTVNPKMWRWKVISGWKWSGRGERINSLELRACLACLRWRLEHVQEHDCRISSIISLTRWCAFTA